MRKPRHRRHLLVIVEKRFFSTCAPHLSVDSCSSKWLTPHVELVTCPSCHRMIRLVRNSMIVTLLTWRGAPSV